MRHTVLTHQLLRYLRQVRPFVLHTALLSWSCNLNNLPIAFCERQNVALYFEYARLVVVYVYIFRVYICFCTMSFHKNNFIEAHVSYLNL